MVPDLTVGTYGQRGPDNNAFDTNNNRDEGGYACPTRALSPLRREGSTDLGVGVSARTSRSDMT